MIRQAIIYDAALKCEATLKVMALRQAASPATGNMAVFGAPGWAAFCNVHETVLV